MDNKNYTIDDVLKALKYFQIINKNIIDEEGNACYDLVTCTKSHLYLYDDGTVKGINNYTNNVFTNSDNIEQVIWKLSDEFVKCLHGCKTYSFFWMNLREIFCKDANEIIKTLK